MDFIIYACIGILAGITSGLLGIGGGIFTVSALTWFFKYKGFPEADIMHFAIATSLASMMLNTAVSSAYHWRKSAIVWSLVYKIIPGVIVGSWVGSFFASDLSSRILQFLFGVFVTSMGIHFIWKKKKAQAQERLPKQWTWVSIGGSIAFLSNILGIGGGVFTLPTLLHYHVDEKKAVGTSSIISFMISMCGTASYMKMGYVYVPAFLGVSFVSIFAATYGAYLSHKLHSGSLRKIFAIVLIFIGFSMICSN